MMPTWRVLTLLTAVSATLLLGGWAWQVRGQPSEGEENHHRSGGSGTVTLGIAGDAGTRFDGTCSVREDERDVGGRVPRSFEFDLRGGELACEIRTDGAGGELRIVLSDENSRSVHRSVGESVTRFVYEEGEVTSMSSSTSQTTSTTTHGSSTSLT